MSLEEVIAADPDFIFVVTMGSSEEAALDYMEQNFESNPAWAELTAVQEDHYVLLPKELFHYKPNARWGRVMPILRKSCIRSLPPKSGKGRAAMLAALAALLLASVLLSLRFGSQNYSLAQLIAALRGGDTSDPVWRILVHVRLPRTLAGLAAGGALATAGALIQSVLNNAMASPNVIGVNAGAGFFAMLAVTLAPGAAGVLPAASFLGALCTALFIYALAARAGLSRTTLILAGIAVSSILTAGVNAITLLYPDDVIGATGFMLGGFSGVTIASVGNAAWYMAAGLCLPCFWRPI